MKIRAFQFLFILLLLAGCTAPQSNPSFDEIKKMMTDAIQTEDGKNALRKILAEEDFRELLILEQAEVKSSIEETLLSDKGEAFWKKAFEDAKFTEAIAKSMKDQHEEVMTKLMDDASFQTQLKSFFKQPDMQKQLEEIMKSSTMKEQYEEAIEEIINSPLLQTKWEKLIREAGKTNDEEEKGNEQEETQKKEEEKSGSDS